MAQAVEPKKQGQPLQIISFDKDSKLTFDKAKLESILNSDDEIKDLSVVILAVVGAFREGKSFLLSWMIRYLESDNFHVSLDEKLIYFCPYLIYLYIVWKIWLSNFFLLKS